jgi:hypothetical protein
MFRDRGISIAMKIKNMADCISPNMFRCNKKVWRYRHTEKVVKFSLILPTRVIARCGGIMSRIRRLPKHHGVSATAEEGACQQRNQEPDSETHNHILPDSFVCAIKSYHPHSRNQIRLNGDQTTEKDPRNTGYHADRKDLKRHRSSPKYHFIN